MDCSFESCGRTAWALGLCGTHYRQRSRGVALTRIGTTGYKPLSPAVFWENVSKGDNCWRWTGMVGTGGYGLRGRNPSVLMHRYSWELHNGPIPEGLLVCHHCDNPICVRPDHLFLGTATDNNVDRSKKGRSASILNHADVREIRSMHSGGEKAGPLADQYGVSIWAIYNILSGRCWMHVS